MKPILLSALGCVAARSVEAQGVFNGNSYYTPAGSSTPAMVTDLTGAPVSKAVGKVEFVLLDGTSLSPGGSAGVSLTADGLFGISGVTVPGVPIGGTATLVVRAWDSSTGRTYNEAFLPGAVVVTISRLGGGTTPPATFALNSNFTGVQFVIPEPSTHALAVVGVVGMFLAARRKF